MATAGKGSKGKGTAVRFTPEGTQGHHQEGTQGHVHFQEQLHDSAVMVTQDKDGHFLVKVGFLKILHKYEITFVLPPVPSLGKDICPLPVPNPNLRIISVTSLPEGTVSPPRPQRPHPVPGPFPKGARPHPGVPSVAGGGDNSLSSGTSSVSPNSLILLLLGFFFPGGSRP
ncbi:UPF0687 protein C20orf27 homolog [Serinus canaria]|uniref:UPF0687 protein C20orf27 homolog n=1 Tax=Serinus canaria TaxID=9135 RepID=UPI0021CC7298|nr:UPF0687 protein C20orf27 homolog [Serinus canaria]XP_050843611.1 UPF0687 protein C20orf27 homolog [Serinus canaria]